MELLLKYKYYLLSFLVALIIFVLRRVLRYRKKRKKEAELIRQQRRNEALTRALQNPTAKTPSIPPVSVPLEISWDEKSVKKTEANEKMDSMMIELVERTACSRRTYVFRANQTVSIGSSEDNQMVLLREGVALRHCVIAMDGKKPCARSEPGARSLLHRGKTSAIISEGGIFLNNGDLLELGTAQIEFRMLKS